MLGLGTSPQFVCCPLVSLPQMVSASVPLANRWFKQQVTVWVFEGKVTKFKYASRKIYNSLPVGSTCLKIIYMG